MTLFNDAHGVHQSDLGRRDARRAEARRRLRNMSARRKAELAASLGIENTPRALIRYAADNGVDAFPTRSGGHGEGTTY